MAGEKTEKATPKRRAEARKKGQVARSHDLNGAIVLLAALMALSAFAPNLLEELQSAMRDAFALIQTPEVVDHRGLGSVVAAQARSVGLAAAPVILVCMVAGVLANVAQVGGKPHAQALKPDPRRMNPIQGAKNLLGPNGLFEGGKSIIKMLAVGAVATMAVLPRLDEYAAMVGMPPQQLMGELASTIYTIAQRGAMAYLIIGLVDYAWQRYRTEKSMKMDKQSIKDEAKQNDLPQEVKGAIRRRQIMAARARMMADVPQADVVVTNPTHYAVALRYDPYKSAPEVVAKGVDLVAKRIREIATDAGVPIVPDPPLARSLHASVEVGHVIPEEMFQAVAQLLAFVYRTAGRRVA
jgi:flagellar biosynthesis protein FlhB